MLGLGHRASMRLQRLRFWGSQLRIYSAACMSELNNLIYPPQYPKPIAQTLYPMNPANLMFLVRPLNLANPTNHAQPRKTLETHSTLQNSLHQPRSGLRTSAATSPGAELRRKRKTLVTLTFQRSSFNLFQVLIALHCLGFHDL